MHQHTPLARRSLLMGAAGTAALATGTVAGVPAALGSAAWPQIPSTGRAPLWKQADRNGIVFGSSIATWQLEDRYKALHSREAGLLFTEDDLLWYQLKPGPDAALNFAPGGRIINHAERNRQLTIGAHLVWDEGFGEGWTDEDLWDISRRRAEKLLYGVIRQEVRHFKGRMNGWIVANEVTDPEHRDRHGFRKNVPWYQTIGPEYIGECFHLARHVDPAALRIINEFGFETTNEYGDRPEPRRRAFLAAIDRLLDRNVPVQAVGIQGHLLAQDFHRRFDERAYRGFLQEFADRGLPILITELDVLDKGLPTNPRVRDRGVADVYRHYLDVALDERNVKVVVAFGLTDRFSWLDEDLPRTDGTHRRPLAFSRTFRPKPAYTAISNALRGAPSRTRLWRLRKGR